jgi:hypothetical protein
MDSKFNHLSGLKKVFFWLKIGLLRAVKQKAVGVLPTAFC